MTDRRSPMWRLLFLLISALALSTLVLAAACGGDDDDDGGDDDGETATETTDAGEGDDDDGGDDGGDDDDVGDDDDGGDDGGEDDPFAELEDFAGEYEVANGAVTYAFSDDTGSTGTWTIYTEDDKSRVDYGDDSGVFISITTPEISYSCSESDGEGFCFEGEGGVGTNPFAGLFGAFASSAAIEGYINAFSDVEAESSTEEIAGTDASCYSLSGDFTGDEGSIKWCFAESGLLLLAQYDLDSGVFEMRAEEFSDDVPEDIFDPPYEVTTIPGQG